MCHASPKDYKYFRTCSSSTDVVTYWKVTQHLGKLRDNSSIIFICVQVSSAILDVVLRIRIFRSHTHQDPVHLQIFYKGMLNYLAQDTVDQMLPRLDDLLQINGEKTTFFIDFVFSRRDCN